MLVIILWEYSFLLKLWASLGGFEAISSLGNGWEEHFESTGL